jgi:hypothetical protein
VTLQGETKVWHDVILTFDGPSTSESATPNPFTDYRMNVTFTFGTRSLTVPGYFAADGQAAESGATTGAKWRVRFMPDSAGTWTYRVSFQRGTNIALGTAAGTPVVPDGTTGQLNITANDKTGRDLRGQGLLRGVGKHYFQFAGSGKYFVKGGANSPENLLAFADFDATTARHTYSTHATRDYRTGDPLWRGQTRGRGIIGAVNYLASKGLNAVYFLLLTQGGDGKDVWPWTSGTERYRFDVSKLDQWDIVFSHMQKQGIVMQMLFQEREHDLYNFFGDSGSMGNIRKLYLREMIARFGHHPGIVWNLSEESAMTAAQVSTYAAYVRSLDAYRHPIVIHNWPAETAVYSGTVGTTALDGISFQGSGGFAQLHPDVLNWINRSAASGRAWTVSLDEIPPADTGVSPDAHADAVSNRANVRKYAIWGALLAGAGGIEHYFGYKYTTQHDLTNEDWDNRRIIWEQTAHALRFFDAHIPNPTLLKSADGLTAATNDFCFAQPQERYVIFLPAGGTTTLDLGTAANTYTVDWYNPRTGGALVKGTVLTMSGPGAKGIGSPPTEATSDWVALIRRSAGSTAPTYALTVVNGSGSGSYTAGATVTISAATPPAGQVFDRWTGVTVANALAVQTTLSMPSAATTVTATFRTAPATAPAAPSGVILNTPTATSLRLSWSASATATGYRLDVSESSAFTTFVTGYANRDLGNTTSFTITGLAAGRTYYARLRAYNAAGTSANSATQSATTSVSTSQSLRSFTLFNADTNMPIAGFDPLPTGAVLNLSSLPTTRLNIRANTDPAVVGSVRFDLNSTVGFRMENTAPYSLAGDTNGDYLPWTPAVGSYTLSARPFTAAYAGGTAGTALTITFRVETSAQFASDIPTAQDMPITAAPSEGKVRVYPNPWQSDRHEGKPIIFAGADEGSELSIYTLSGHHVMRAVVGSEYRWIPVDENGRRLASGLYLYVLKSPDSSVIRGKLAVIH